MNPWATPCGRCGHTMHGGAQSSSRRCAFPGCDCAEWERPQCPGSLGAAIRGACPGRPFVGGHDASCPDAAQPTAAASGSAHAAAPRLSYVVDAAASIVRLVYEGAPSFEQWQRTMETALGDPAFRAGSSFLVDRRLDEPPSSDYVRRVIRFLWLHLTELAGGRRAIVTWSPASYGMARVEKAIAFDLPIPVEVFMDVDEAERWLGAREAR